MIQDYIDEMVAYYFPNSNIEIEYSGEGQHAVCWLYNVPDGYGAENMLQYYRKTSANEPVLIECGFGADAGQAALDTLGEILLVPNHPRTIIVDGPGADLMECDLFSFRLHELSGQGHDVIVCIH